MLSQSASQLNSVFLQQPGMQESFDSSLVLDEIDVKNDPNARVMVGALNPGGQDHINHPDNIGAF